jgi:molecular chaperone GrpE (heat shock protein)
MPESVLLMIPYIPGGLLVLALVVGGFLYRRQRSIVMALKEVEGFLADVRDPHPRSSLACAVRAHVIPTSNAAPLVVTRPLTAIRRDHAESAIAHHFSFWVGGLFTGLALICTFLLIASVMSSDVSGAIRDSADPTELSGAVSKLGSKFYISAAGVGGSLLLLFFSNLARARIFGLADNPDPRLVVSFISVEAYQLEVKRTEFAELCGFLKSLDRRVEKLNSIEVSVQTIGNEVSANLKNIMKDAMGEQLREMVATTMADVSNIAERVEKNITDSFGQQLGMLATAMQQSLDTLRTAIEGQGQGQLEKILERLQDTVSGGFQSESKKMVAALEGFASVVPALELQLREMTGKVAQESRQRSEASARVADGLLARVTSLMNALGAQQIANAQAIERIQAVSEAGSEQIARRLEATGAGLVTSVLGSSRVEIEAIVGQLRGAAEASASRYVDIEAHADHAASAVVKATEGLSSASRSILEMANHTSAVLHQAKAGSESIHVASREFLEAANALLSSVALTRDVVDRTRAQTGEQQDLLMRQREYTKEVERLWPELFNTYLDKFKRSSEELGRGWQDLHTKITNVTTSVGSEFAENTQVLSEAVDRLVHATNGTARAIR